jgi:predicted MPP superfamily phosphohydrolase
MIMNHRIKKNSISKKIASAFIVLALIGSSIPIGVDTAAHSNSKINVQNIQKCTKSTKFKNAKIAVFSDPHYFAPELGTTGAAFEAYLAQDRKLIAESSAISAAAIDELKKSDAKIILISGDLTKDGEKLSHQQFSKLLKDLEKSGKTVVGFMHHGLLEHFNGQKQFFGEFVIDNWEKVSEEFADLGMEAVFTGHFHAQDIASKTTAAGNKIYDIETGSLVSYPSPYRIVDITKDKLTIESKNIKSIKYDTKGAPYQDYAYNYLKTGLKDVLPLMFTSLIMRMNPTLTEEQAYTLAKQAADTQPAPQLTPKTVCDLLSNAMIAHYKGDEDANPFYLPILCMIEICLFR